MVERSLSMREVPGSIPGASKFLNFMFEAEIFVDTYIQYMNTVYRYDNIDKKENINGTQLLIHI